MLLLGPSEVVEKGTGLVLRLTGGVADSTYR